MRRDRRKDLYKTQRNSLEGPQEEAEIQRKALRRGKNLAFSEDTCLEKERVRSKVTPRKVGVGLKRRREPSRRRLGWRLAWWGSTKKKEASHLLGLTGRHQYSDQRYNQNSSLCGLHRSGDRGGGGPNGQIVSVKRAADGRRQRSRKIINEEREKYRAKNRSLRNTSTDSKGEAFVILNNHPSTTIRKESLSPTSKAMREANRNEFVEKGGMPDRVKSFREIDSGENRWRARPGFVKPIRNGLRKVQNLIKCRPTRAETGLAGRENRIRFQKEE